jgi:phenylalanyl-tRNA synthetase beta chain
MPAIEISKKDLLELVGKQIAEKELEKLLIGIKCEVEFSGDLVKINVADVNRPDLLSCEGIAREIKGITGKEKGFPKIKIEKSDYFVKVDSELKEIRPNIACAVIKGVKLNEESIKQLIQLQEKLCENFGRGRKEAALGIYDFDKISWPVNYKAVAPGEVKFIPLDFSEALTPAEILRKHEKGIQYRHLLESCKKYPLLIDSKKEVLSMPPIINSNSTGKVSEKTKNIFIEVTGYNLRFVIPVLNIMVASIAERGGKIYSVRIPELKITTPDFTPKKISLDIDYCNKIIGTNFKAEEIVKLLEKARFECSVRGNKTEVSYLPYRQDIMDERDVIEEVALAYGYQNLSPEKPEISTIGKISELTNLKEKINCILIGLGMQEVATFTLTDKENLTKKFVNTSEIIEVANPVSANYQFLRNTTLPSILEFLSANIKKEFPQKIFEIGECYDIKEEKTKTNLCVALSGTGNFTEIRQIFEYVARYLGLTFEVKKSENENFIEGRQAAIFVDGKRKGILGEINPKILHNFGLEMPTSIFEFELN